jgi:hypothetical protein
METQSVTPQSANTTAMDETEIAHFAGVFDKGGSITVRVANDESYSLKYDYRPTLIFTHPRREGDPMMGAAAAYCENHDVRYSVSKNGDSDVLTVTKSENIKNFLTPMLPYLVSQHEPAVLMLDEILPAVEDKKHRDKQGFYELMALADVLRKYTNRAADVKYDQDYFAEKWSVVQ